MTRAERAMHLHVGIYIRGQMKKFVTLTDVEEERYVMEQRELAELRCQMGGSDRRQFARLMQEWEG